MFVLYYDEVKYDPPKQPSFWLGGIALKMQDVPAIEEEMNALSKEIFGKSNLIKETEFHGIEICRGKGNFKGKNQEERWVVLKRILSILTKNEIFRIHVQIKCENLKYTPKKPDEVAFMFFIEKANELFRSQGSVGMIFGDYDEPIIGSSVVSLCEYRRNGTLWMRGRDIDHIVDTVHFAKSHHSRMIQLADVFLYVTQFYLQDNSAAWRAAIQKIIMESGVTWSHKYREWPNEPRWYR